MSAETVGQQLTFDDIDVEHDFEEEVIHDDRVLEPMETCAHCAREAIQEGLCQRHLHEYRRELCGDGQL